MLSRAFLSAFIGASHVYDCLENDDDSMSPVSQLAVWDVTLTTIGTTLTKTFG